ncbi:MAG TPA: hypothetical protein VGG39_17635 [Polyangiaceae bacterium]|jgi:hypothetical protein
MPTSVSKGVAAFLGSGCLAGALMTTGGCNRADDAQCYCPNDGPGVSTIEVACDQLVTATAGGGCTASVSGSFVGVEQGEAGAGCQVVVTVGATTTTVAFTFTQEWIACGSDPHGCGQGFTTSPAYVTLPCGDAGVGTTAPDAAGE